MSELSGRPSPIGPIDSWASLTESQRIRPATPAHGEAMLRAYTLARSIDYGMAVDDFIRLEARVQGGADWVQVLECLGEDNLQRAGQQSSQGHSGFASTFYLLAAACLRLAQAGAEEDEPRRLGLYQRQAHAFAKGVERSGLNAQAIDFNFNGARHRGWFVRPGSAQKQPAPCVLVWGGADGWCEAFWRSLPAFIECDLSVCLIELPGQGLARLQGGSFLRADFTQMLSAVMDELAAKGAHPSRFGVVGHSMGGTLAMAAAAADERIAACVNNGGVWQRSSGEDKYPRATQRVGRMLGPDGDVSAFYESLKLQDAIRSMHAKLLCVQGGKDVLVADEQANQIVAMRGLEAASLAYWVDGVHCIYNHALERNAVVAEWLARVLPNGA